MSENENKAKRRPVAAAATVSKGGNSYLIVVCDDGSAWRSQATTGATWDEMQPVPGTAREREKGR
jgi:hypothetical protein